MQSSIEEALENHPCFSQKKVPQSYDKSGPLRNEICFHPEVGLVVINSQTINVVDVNTKQYITLSPQSKIHPMHGGIINSSGNLLAIQGNNQILLIGLTEEVRLLSMNGKGNGEEIRCGSKVLQLGPIHHTEIRKIAWHPLSDTHLVVLTNDSLRLFNCHSNSSDVEQSFYLTDSIDAISFSFGGSSYLDSWQRFTIFILNRTGHIYAICPVVPYDCMIPVEYLSMLQEQMREKDDDNAVRWIKEIKGPNIKVDFKSPIGIKRVNKRGNSKPKPVNTKSKKVFSANFDSEEDSSVEDEPEEQEKGYIRTQKPRSFDNTLRVQGPLTDSNDINTRFECSDILALPTTPTVIMRAFEDALIEVFLLFEDIQPKWGRDGFKKQKDQASLVLYERIDLGLPTYNSEMGPCRLSPGTNASASNYEFYAFHGAGVHRIKLTSMALISDSLFNSDPSRVEKESIQQSETSYLLNTLPLDAGENSRPVVLVGFAIASVDGKLMIVTRDTEGKCRCVSDSVSPASKKFFDNAPEIVSQPKKFNIELPPKVTKVTNIHFEKQSQSIVYMISQTEDRSKTQFAVLHKIDLQLKEQLQTLRESYKDQQAMLVASQDKKEVINERFEQISQTIKEVQEAQRELIRRANVAHNTIVHLQKNLTKAEMKFHAELISLKKQTDNQNQEVVELAQQLERIDFREVNEKQVIKPKEVNIQKILPILEQEGNMIAGIQQQTQDLQCEVLKLYGLSVL